jgi:5-methylthioadenosine/S-adenosylhomocysteine deaminase
MPQAIATLLNARWIVPVEPEGLILEHHALAIRTDGFSPSCPRDEAALRFSAVTCLNLNRMC